MRRALSCKFVVHHPAGSPLRGRTRRHAACAVMSGRAQAQFSVRPRTTPTTPMTGAAGTRSWSGRTEKHSAPLAQCRSNRPIESRSRTEPIFFHRRADMREPRHVRDGCFAKDDLERGQMRAAACPSESALRTATRAGNLREASGRVALGHRHREGLSGTQTDAKLTHTARRAPRVFSGDARTSAPTTHKTLDARQSCNKRLTDLWRTR
jgi:hypothetical protein